MERFVIHSFNTCTVCGKPLEKAEGGFESFAANIDRALTGGGGHKNCMSPKVKSDAPDPKAEKAKTEAEAKAKAVAEQAEAKAKAEADVIALGAARDEAKALGVKFDRHSTLEEIQAAIAEAQAKPDPAAG